jgi:HK97 family phage prohead protease
MTIRESREFVADLEVRSDGRTVVGIVVPFDRPASIAGRYDETFKRGAFTRTIAERGPARVKLLRSHDTGLLPVGRATLLREDTAGLYGEFRVSSTVAGDEVLTLIRDGALDAFSVGFGPIRDAWNATRDAVDRLEVKLYEVSVVSIPAFEGALIAGVRSADIPRSVPTALLRRRLALISQEY